jgi:hypothetical protein
MTDSSAFLPRNRRRQELCGAGPGLWKTNSRSPRWDPSAITGVSSRPPHDVATPRYAPPCATSPRCYARCSEASLRDPGIRPRYACSAGRPAPRCCKAPRPHRHPRLCCWGNAMPTVRITDAPLTIEDLLAVPTARRWNWLRGTHQDRRRPSRGGPGLAAGNAVHGLTARVGYGKHTPAGTGSLGLAEACLMYGGIVYHLLLYDVVDQFADRAPLTATPSCARPRRSWPQR